MTLFVQSEKGNEGAVEEASKKYIMTMQPNLGIIILTMKCGAQPNAKYSSECVSVQ
jgi:hypothetical protein